MRLRQQRRLLGMPRLQFPLLDRSLEVAAGQRLLDACEANGIPMDAACGGFAACNTCRVCIIEGELSPLEESEEPFLDRPDQRLACQAYVVGDLILNLDPGA